MLSWFSFPFLASPPVFPPPATPSILMIYMHDRISNPSDFNSPPPPLNPKQACSARIFQLYPWVAAEPKHMTISPSLFRKSTG